MDSANEYPLNASYKTGTIVQEPAFSAEMHPFSPSLSHNNNIETQLSFGWNYAIAGIFIYTREACMR